MIGTILSNRYEIQEKLGSGGMAVVYKAKDTLLDRTVAVKVLRDQFTSDATFVDRFRREAKAGGRLSHPNIVSIYDVGHDGEIQFLVMEYVEGKSLKEVIQEKGRLEEEEILDIGAQLCEALEHAHENGLVHRDIKPHNILITKRGRVKVTDFGIARACTSDTVTFAGSIMGSVHYFSPEQAKGGTAEIRSDIYAASVVLYELATGEVPFKADTAVSVALKHIEEKPVPPRQLNPSISPALEEIILKGMNKKPGDRYSSAGEMRDELLKLSGKTVDSLTGGTNNNRKDKGKRLRPAGWVAIVLGLILVAALGYYGTLGFFNVAEVKVPDVTNQSVDKAGSILSDAGLRTEITAERYDPEVPEKHVISQDPKAGEVVKKNRKIQLEVSLGAKMAEVPDVTGQNVREARIALLNSGFEVADKTGFTFSADVPEDQVVSQTPAAHSSISMGTEVELVVSKGPEPEYIQMPDLVGLTLTQAEKKMEDSRLELGVVTHEESAKYFSGQVVSQDVQPGTSILQGYSVNLVVSKGPGPTPQYANVTVPLPFDGKSHQVRIVVSDAKGDHEEYDSLHNSGEMVRTKVPFYGTGTVMIYRDDKLIFEQPVP